MKYYYIIMFDGHIIELPYTAESIKGAFAEWRRGGIILTKDKGGIHGSSISKILPADEYKNWYLSTKPKEYILDGTWRDGKEHGVIRREKWKLKEIADSKKLQLAEPEEVELASTERTEKLAKMKESLRTKMVLK